MDLRASFELFGRTERDLPKDEELIKATEAVASRLQALSRAPVAG